MAPLYSMWFTVLLFSGVAFSTGCDMKGLQDCLKLMTANSSDTYAICSAMDDAKDCLMNLADSTCTGRINATATRLLSQIESDRSGSICKDFQAINFNLTCAAENATDVVIECFKLFPIPMVSADRSECRALPAIQSCLKPFTDNCPDVIEDVYSKMPYDPMVGLEAMCADFGQGVPSNGTGDSGLCGQECFEGLDNITETMDSADVCRAMSETHSCLQTTADNCIGPVRQAIDLVQSLLDKSERICESIDGGATNATNETTMPVNGTDSSLVNATDSGLVNVTDSGSVNITDSGSENVTDSNLDNVTDSNMVNVTDSNQVTVTDPIPTGPPCTMSNYKKCVRPMEENLSKPDSVVCRGFREGRACLEALSSRGCTGKTMMIVKIALDHLEKTKTWCEGKETEVANTNVAPTSGGVPELSTTSVPDVTTVNVRRAPLCTEEKVSNCVSKLNTFNHRTPAREICSTFNETKSCLMAMSGGGCSGKVNRTMDIVMAQLRRSQTSFCAGVVADSRTDSRTSSRPDYRPSPRPDNRPSSRPDNRPSSRPDSRPSSRPSRIRVCTVESVSRCTRRLDSLNQRISTQVICSTFDETRSCLTALSKRGCRGKARQTVRIVLNQLEQSGASLCQNLRPTTEAPTLDPTTACASDNLYKCGPEYMTTSFKTNPCQFAVESIRCLERFSDKCSGEMKVHVDTSMNQLREMARSMCQG